MSLALAHEYFSAHGGAERVVETFHRMHPDAPVYTFFHDRRAYGPLPGYQLRTSFLQSVPLSGGHRLLLPHPCAWASPAKRPPSPKPPAPIRPALIADRRVWRYPEESCSKLDMIVGPE